jgi:hypothetical protein
MYRSMSLIMRRNPPVTLPRSTTECKIAAHVGRSQSKDSRLEITENP